MTDLPALMEPMRPTDTTGVLQDLALAVQTKSATLSGMLHPKTQLGVLELVRVINSYYSNLIEGNSTHPIEIERAMKQDYSQDPAKRNLQMESLAHIECQKRIEERLSREPDLDPTHPDDFLAWAHGIFYERLPEEFHWITNDETGERVRVVGGEFRQRYVKVAHHIPPEHESLPMFLTRFHQVYRRTALHGLDPIILAGAAHHRLAWIHPFLDGNGRVARLFTDTYLRQIPMPGYGLWNVSRGLARNKDRYMQVLAGGDAARQGDLDGRGNLSNAGLVAFCDFFLRTCLDQVEYMGSVLALDGLLERVERYVRLRADKLAPGATGAADTQGLKPISGKILQEVLLRGELGRGDAAAASGSPRSGRDALPQLLAEGLLISNMPKGPVRMGFPPHAAGYLFPDMFPLGVPGR